MFSMNLRKKKNKENPDFSNFEHEKLQIYTGRLIICA